MMATRTPPHRKEEVSSKEEPARRACSDNGDTTNSENESIKNVDGSDYDIDESDNDDNDGSNDNAFD
jgi:hypothetical protein